MFFNRSRIWFEQTRLDKLAFSSAPSRRQNKKKGRGIEEDLAA